jgi:hypothetical protein
VPGALIGPVAPGDVEIPAAAHFLDSVLILIFYVVLETTLTKFISFLRLLFICDFTYFVLQNKTQTN